MSKYNYAKAVEFISHNKEFLVRLDKFKGLSKSSRDSEFLNRMKITIEDMIKFMRKNKDKKLDFKMKELVLVNASTSFREDNINVIENGIKNNFPRDKFFDFESSTNKISNREGTMSFSLCNEITFLKKPECFESEKCHISKFYLSNVSINPRYYSLDKPYSFGRITYFFNDLPLTILNFYTADRRGRIQFRREVTQLILGDDYLTKITNFNGQENHIGFFKDKTIGQEIYYYFLEIYNYDRYNYFINSYIKNNLSEEVVKLSFGEFVSTLDDDYPDFDGVVYFDTSSFKDIDYPGPEVLIFSAELKLSICGYLMAWNNKYYTVQQKQELKDDFLKYINNRKDYIVNENVLEPCEVGHC